MANSVWSRFSTDPRVAASTSTRATDSDRDVVLEVLRSAYADGRLDVAEHDARTSRALELDVLGDVPALIGDLAGADDPIRAQARRAYDQLVREARTLLLGVAAVSLVLWLLIGWATDSLGFFWPVVPIAAASVPWLWRTVGRGPLIGRIEDGLRRNAADRERLHNRRPEEGSA